METDALYYDLLTSRRAKFTGRKAERASNKEGAG